MFRRKQYLLCLPVDHGLKKSLCHLHSISFWVKCIMYINIFFFFFEMHERYSILKKQVEKIWTICQLSLNYNFQMMKLSYCLYHKMAAECTMSNEPLSGSTASCTWCQGLKHRTPLLKQNHVVAVGPGLSYVSQTISLIHKA